MHLKPCPKLIRSELRLDAASVQSSSQRSSLFVVQQGALRRTCSSNHGNISSSRLPFSIISTNAANSNSGGVASLQLKALSSPAVQLVPPPLDCENDTLRLYQTTTEDANAPLDIWTVIKPGHVREKIAIFASEGGRTDGAGGNEHISTSSLDRTPAMCMNHTDMSGLSRATKAKGSWEENSSAKRRRRSGSNQNQNLQQDQMTQVLDTQQHTLQLSSCRPDLTRQSGIDQCGSEAVTVVEVEEEHEHKVSVVEMVAFLEQRVSEQQPDCKPLLALQRSSTTITLSRALPPEIRREGSEVRGEELESIRVSEMVAKLESECLRRKAEGDLSRSNSLRRTVGRVLLAAGDHSSAPSQLASSVTSSFSLSSLPGARAGSQISSSETAQTHAPALALATPSSPHPGELVGESEEARGAEGLAQSTVSENVAPPPPPEEAEPLPGLLFLSPPAELLPHTDSLPPPTDSEHHPPHYRTTCDLQPAPSQPWPSAVSLAPDSGSQSEKRRRRQAGPGGDCVGVSPLSRRASASQDFLEMRQRVQQLLVPQLYLAVLPHHLLVKIFLLLPTQSLAALKCTCHYFKFVIENYGVRPADSLWVSDPRYRDDPCKQCKKRYDRGDVSLCRWHHKPYCQALPYGPGYWMCCHGPHRDTPGCNVGLHDNRWVPPFHSINMPIYRRSRNDEND